MRTSRLIAPIVVTIVLAACGGSGDSNTATNSVTSPQASYSFSPPAPNTRRSFTQTITDNFNNVIQESVSLTVTAVNADGSYSSFEQDPNADAVVVDGTTWSVLTQTINYNNNAQEISYSYTNAKGDEIACLYDPYGNGPPYPLVVGASWTTNYTITCGPDGTPISYTQSGTIVDVEQVSVPAGTFAALKLQSIVNWTNANGTNIEQTITNWRDVVTQQPVKRITQWSYSGTLPSNGYAMTTDLELESVE